ncbi:hypothetical protein [Streptomyces chiangmaiensis]|uniref:Uncharacterized protein n=1 Tax=Streptomyces chiangmaiensis TaxID=766497 RepID=A0ABU7FFF4_9ACTN|nr:hypothetical protein [Streptomyces chiangmaiensis]MED7822706.1 hypothetical protein [Streptomyces chiangmaiensis]
MEPAKLNRTDAFSAFTRGEVGMLGKAVGPYGSPAAILGRLQRAAVTADDSTG